VEEKELTKKVLAEVVASGIEVKFSSYYKYEFTFIGENSSFHVRTTYGGCGDDVYRYDVDTRPIKFDMDLEYKWKSVTVTDKKTKQEYYWYDERW